VVLNDVIIINWNSGNYLKNCINSLVAAHAVNPLLVNRVIIVDNNSSDDSLSGMDKLNLPIEIIRNKINMGFGAACNQGAVLSNADYLLFLNPDTEVLPYSIQTCIHFMEKKDNSNIGACGLKLTDDKGNIHRSCARFPAPGFFLGKALGLDMLLPGYFHSVSMREWDHLSNRAVDHVIGAFYLIRRPLFLQLRGFDERFFVYLEDLDLSLRLSKMGYQTFYLSETSAYHKGGGTSDKIKATRLFYALRSQIIYSFKHFNFLSALLTSFVTLCIEPIVRLSVAVVQGSGKTMVATVKGYCYLWGWFIQYFLRGKHR
jgi:N-acetylglucosaminyl-diphospho-decaprenol L-rhamnosyltransferase